jgi:hypothetical protein
MTKPSVLQQAARLVRGLRRCFVCGQMRGDTVKLSDPRMAGLSPRTIARGITRPACKDCIDGQPWSLKATASADDPMLTYLEQYAPLFTLFPPHVARCLTGRHKHPVRRPFSCLTDWKALRGTRAMEQEAE